MLFRLKWFREHTSYNTYISKNSIWYIFFSCIYAFLYINIFQYRVSLIQYTNLYSYHDDAIKWKHFPRYWPFVRGIHRSSVNSPHKGQWRGALMFSLICTRINGWVNNGEAGDLRRHGAHYDVTIMHCGDITCVEWHLKSPTTQHFVQPFVQANNK